MEFSGSKEGPSTTECEACSKAKIKRQVNRAPREYLEQVGERLALDFHDFHADLKGYTSLMLITDRWSDFSWPFFLTNREWTTIRQGINWLINWLRRFSIQVKVIESDREITGQLLEQLEALGINCERSAARTQAQNSAAERSGGVVKEMIRTMSQESNFPDWLWTEIAGAAIYLRNRLPSAAYNWQTRFKRFYTHAYLRIGVVIPEGQLKL
jgi:hypothetical protein